MILNIGATWYFHPLLPFLFLPSSSSLPRSIFISHCNYNLHHHRPHHLTLLIGHHHHRSCQSPPPPSSPSHPLFSTPPLHHAALTTVVFDLQSSDLNTPSSTPSPSSITFVIPRIFNLRPDLQSRLLHHTSGDRRFPITPSNSSVALSIF
ncbi:hypothetical protein MtrunA17_Chr7g0276221 [Medicago truncatula]|uniref:Uncharacterized protein n=1 Tax=Medicago truncatula TaxID=3880 RepID=Q2HTD2_MEDTR|nr:hypothetical protein MtrDRAFT_AC150443g7v2 [Medicago truncatula]AES82817.1 hypothetical protein MTR_7g118150 [Medicago truncatula]RHN49598.1 hypothetical protein MtrunA17_Chr7g0276221 [Medicago truncatula]